MNRNPDAGLGDKRRGYRTRGRSAPIVSAPRLHKTIAGWLAVTWILALAGCGDPDETQVVTARPSTPRFCYQADLRRALAERPPAVPFTLRNQDLDNFTGATEAECNERQMIYAGLRPPTGLQRPALGMTFQFQPTEAAAERALGKSGAKGPVVDGERLTMLGVAGTLTGRFAHSGAVIDVTVACLPKDESLELVPCRKSPAAPELQAEIVDATRRLLDRLDQIG